MAGSVNLFVLNWNGRDLTLDCLSSLEKVIYPNVKIHIIDNGSSDNSVVSIRNKFPDYEIIELAENHGFAKGNNTGFQSVKQKADYTIFLNNDTIVDPNFIDPLVNELEAISNVKQTAPKIFYEDKKEYIWFAGGIISLWTGVIRHSGIRKKDSSKFSQKRKIDYATGCCVCMRTVDFESIGMFDESFLLYGEDVDLSLRFSNQGGEILFVPESKIWHKVSASLGGQSAFGKWKRKLSGKMKLVRKHSPGYQVIISLFMIMIMSILELIYSFIIKLGGKNR
ncbi:MAG TPA: glycosyltransferase family 2 protein [Candidatus Marinimicrobia bacterium]|mgnify:CR=1 FL=1|jgi:GT2 family glycosyltransferase|nr:glycosyltransferase family 2 protein [Candidatus Neomarinimicrobiota bacterium]